MNAIVYDKARFRAAIENCRQTCEVSEFKTLELLRERMNASVFRNKIREFLNDLDVPSTEIMLREHHNKYHFVFQAECVSSRLETDDEVVRRVMNSFEGQNGNEWTISDFFGRIEDEDTRTVILHMIQEEKEDADL